MVVLCDNSWTVLYSTLVYLYSHELVLSHSMITIFTADRIAISSINRINENLYRIYATVP